MPSHASTAAKVRAEKARHPERFCPDCLWRTGGGYCPRHVPSPDPRYPKPAQTVGPFADPRAVRQSVSGMTGIRKPEPIPVLAPITARPVDLNPAAWGDDDDEPACYVRGCGAIDDLEPAGFPGQSLWVCPECKASYRHQEALRQEFGAEGREP